MRLSLPVWGRRPDRVMVRSAEALAYRVPMDLASEDTQRTVAPFNYLIVLSGVGSDGRELTGVGEAQPRSGQTGDAHGESWAYLDRTLADMAGMSLDLKAPLFGIQTYVQALEEAAGLDDVNSNIRLRATIMGVEAALLDLLANASGTTLADLLGRRAIRRARLPTLVRRREPSEIAEFLGSRARKGVGALRLIGGDDLNADLVHMRTVAHVRREVAEQSADEPLWMNFRGRLDSSQARLAVQEIVNSVVEGRLPKNITIQNPIPKNEYEFGPCLQAYADRLSADHSSPPDVRVLLRNVGFEETCNLFSDDPESLRIVNIRPAEIGGILKTVELVRALTQQAPNLEIMLTHFPGAARVTQMVHRDIAQVLPNLQYLATIADVDKSLKVSRRRSRWQRSPFLRRGTGVELEYRALVGHARDRIFHTSMPRDFGSERAPNAYADANYIAPIGAYATHGHIVEREALAYGLNSWRFTKASFVAATPNGKEILPFRRSRWPLSGVAAASIAKNKEATRILLRRAGCPVPEGRTFSGGDRQGALDFAARIGYPVVVKPAEGSMGVGVVANIQSSLELQTAFDMLARTVHGEDDFIVESHIRGGDYRVMVIGNEVVAAVRRRPASVVGDGIQTVGQLMTGKNVERQGNPHLGLLRIPWNEATAHELRKSGYGFDDIVRAGERVQLSSTSNLTQGGDSIEILEELHPSIRLEAVRAVRAVPGMEYCGVDFLLEDHTQPLDSQDGAICELNVMAALPVGEYPAYGESRPLAEKFIQECAKVFDFEIHDERAEQLQLELTICGGVNHVGYQQWFARRATKFGLAGWIRETGKRELQARLKGPTAPVTALVTAAILGPPKATPESVFTKQVSGMYEDKFTNLDKGWDAEHAEEEEVTSSFDRGHAIPDEEESAGMENDEEAP